MGIITFSRGKPDLKAGTKFGGFAWSYFLDFGAAADEFNRRIGGTHFNMQIRYWSYTRIVHPYRQCERLAWQRPQDISCRYREQNGRLLTSARTREAQFVATAI